MGTFYEAFMKHPAKKSEAQNETCMKLYERLHEGREITLRGFQMRFAKSTGNKFAARRICSPEEIAKMEAAYPPVKEDTKRVNNQVAAEEPPPVVEKPAKEPVKEAPVKPKIVKAKEPVDYVRISALIVSALIVVGHAVLICYDCALLWGVPGLIAGIVVVLMVIFGMLAMSSPAMKGVTDNVLWVVWTLEGAAIFVHFPSFTSNAVEAYARGLGEMHTWLLSAIICICSIAATFFYKETILTDKTHAK